MEYLRFEVRFFEKVRERILILNGSDKKIDFIVNEEEEQDQEEIRDDGRLSDSTKLIEIVFENIKEQFGTNLSVIKACNEIAKESTLLPENIKVAIKTFYQTLK